MASRLQLSVSGWQLRISFDHSRPLDGHSGPIDLYSGPLESHSQTLDVHSCPLDGHLKLLDDQIWPLLGHLKGCLLPLDDHFLPWYDHFGSLEAFG